ncbi:hypothetical protein BpHYR1_044335 [Brachionus plicatilis]|uniref:Uncharacterized protein n=1 Tax=Brachionus plicatilis TaxID=10195 RepID=A0A3M7RTB7_BRAPC|nr:hypothetical protein BpHYR1_044335 [Brachionus plicatilis]
MCLSSCRKKSTGWTTKIFKKPYDLFYSGHLKFHKELLRWKIERFKLHRFTKLPNKLFLVSWLDKNKTRKEKKKSSDESDMTCRWS